MKRYRIVFAEEADRQLLSIWRYLAEQADSEAADAFTRAILDRCRTLDTFPGRGTLRGDLRPGLRTVPIPRRATIGYTIVGDDVVIVAIACRGQDLAGLIGDDAEGAG